MSKYQKTPFRVLVGSRCDASLRSQPYNDYNTKELSL